MANTATIIGSFTLNVGGIRNTADLYTNITLTGDNIIVGSVPVTSSAYTALDTSSLADMRMMWLYNDSTSSMVTVATDAAGTKPIAILSPEDSALVPWSGSTQVWVKITSGSKDATFQYSFTEK